jgi:hypothetical protein
VGETAWTNPSRITAYDVSYATCTGGAATVGHHYGQALKGTNFGFSLPADAEILGIEVFIDRKATFSLTKYIRDYHVRLINSSGTLVGDDKADLVTKWGSVVATITYGSSSDTWSAGLTVTDINNSNFGIWLEADWYFDTAATITGSVDAFWIKVYWKGSPTNAGLSGTAADDATVGTQAWTNPTYAQTYSGLYYSSYATATGVWGYTKLTHYLNCTNFAFNIPTSAIISGVVVNINRQEATGSVGSNFVKDSVVKLVKGGVVSGNSKADVATEWPTYPPAVKSYGSSTDLWGLALTPADVNASNFGVVISAAITFALSTSVSAQVDYVSITVYYTVLKMSGRWAQSFETQGISKFCGAAV